MAVHAIYEDGDVSFVFDTPCFRGPIQVLVIFPDEELDDESNSWAEDPF